MFKRLLIAGAAVALLSSGGVAYAQMQKIEQKELKPPEHRGDVDEMLLNQERCGRLIKQFDAADGATGNEKAMALRKQGETDCTETLVERTGDGIKELEEALRMVGQKPVM